MNSIYASSTTTRPGNSLIIFFIALYSKLLAVGLFGVGIKIIFDFSSADSKIADVFN